MSEKPSSDLDVVHNQIQMHVLIDTMGGQVDAMLSERNAQIVALKANLAEMTTEREALREKVATLRVALAGMTTERDILKTDVTSMEWSLHELQNRVRDLTRKPGGESE